MTKLVSHTNKNNIAWHEETHPCQNRLPNLLLVPESSTNKTMQSKANNYAPVNLDTAVLWPLPCKLINSLCCNRQK